MVKQGDARSAPIFDSHFQESDVGGWTRRAASRIVRHDDVFRIFAA
jgi:hypothetical protein